LSVFVPPTLRIANSRPALMAGGQGRGAGERLQAATAGPPQQHGLKPKYGPKRLSRPKWAAHRKGWQALEVVLHGRKAIKTYTAFLATYRPAGGLIRVVLVREAKGWVAIFCLDAEAWRLSWRHWRIGRRWSRTSTT
jgi:hypothetical protein